MIVVDLSVVIISLGFSFSKSLTFTLNFPIYKWLILAYSIYSKAQFITSQIMEKNIDKTGIHKYYTYIK